MSDIKLTTTIDADNPTLHDLEIRDGQIQWVGLDPYDSDDQAAMIAQRVACRLLKIRGEWYLDQKRGTPWRELTAKGTTTGRMERIFRSVIEGTPGISSVASIAVTSDPETRLATVTWTGYMDTGQQIGPVELDTPFVVTET